MPELPEVETVMRGLSTRLLGRTIVSAAVRRPDLRRPMPPGLQSTLQGARIESFRRRAKYILMRLRGGTSVLLHLGMSGRMNLRTDPAPTLHEHVAMTTDDGWTVGFVDPRRFGSIDLVPTEAEDAHVLLAALGPEPLDEAFTPAVLAAAFAGRRTPVKAALLDQRIVAGLGNIYVCEALFRAGIAPGRLAGTVNTDRLVPEIKATLQEAIAAGGSTLRDYVQPDGELGYFQHAWRVYGREGAACPHCPGPDICPGIARMAQAGRSTFYCPVHQAPVASDP